MSERESLKRMADMAGVSEEAFLKVAGVLYLFEKGFLRDPRSHDGGQAPKSDLEKRVMHILSVERALSTRDLMSLLHIEEGDLEAIVQKLEADGKVVTSAIPPNIKIVAVANDGTMNIASLNSEERQWMIINAYGNRDKGLTYSQLYSFLKAPPHPGEPTEKKGRKWEILQALKQGPKKRSELARTLNLSDSTVGWALKELLRDGKIERVEKGLYKLVNSP
ncbi:winged helix-turn-helix domain-containing protein [Thermofilum sp.]|uniref:winged helix-turn-helix domain-containing protein n=1 Tax=Thermofilum sp. TaxID=1961369 RepID=UPI003166FFC6